MAVGPFRPTVPASPPATATGTSGPSTSTPRPASQPASTTSTTSTPSTTAHDLVGYTSTLGATGGWTSSTARSVGVDVTLTSTPPPKAVVGGGASVFDLQIGRALHATTTTFTGVRAPQFEQTLDRTTGSVARKDNHVTPLFDGEQSFRERLLSIAQAQSSVHLQTFIFTDDDTGWNMARHLAERARAGVDVRVIVDGLGSNRSSAAIFDFMRASGVEVRAHETGLDLLAVNNRWHEKHLVIDGVVAIEGGMNIADEYSLGGSGRKVFRGSVNGMDAWRDVDVRVEGPAVADVQTAFLRNWALLGDPVPTPMLAKLFPAPTITAGGPEVRVVQHHPVGDPPDDHTTQLHVQAINAATTSITVENAYFIPPPVVREAFKDAARRGVDVKIATNSKASSDMGFVVDAQRYFYGELLDAGVQIFEKQGGTLHAKTMTVDGAWSIIGSVNLNGRSDGLDTEAAVAIRCDTVAASLEQRFVDGMVEVRPVTMTEVQRAGSFLGDVKQWAMATLAWTL